MEMNEIRRREEGGVVMKVKGKVMKIISNIRKTGEADPRRIIHSVKVGIALTLVSLLYYIRPLYHGFGVSGMWAVLTVVVVFEFTVGATISKGLNRGFATLLAGAVGVGAQHLANAFGETAKPFVLGILVFALAGGATFSRFFKRIKARYDYGVVIFILTFSLVTVSGQRVENIFELAHQRLLTILVGGATCLLISLFVFPVWAGQDLHNLLASHLHNLAIYLQEFEGQYFQCSKDKSENPDKPAALQGYKTVLNSKVTEESLANFARWEPGHGRFGLRHPWKYYLKIGALARECAYKIETLNTYLNPQIHVSLKFKGEVEKSCRMMSSESSKALKALSSSINTMTHPSDAKSHLENFKTAIQDLKIVLQNASLENEEDLLAIVPVATVASILVEITKSIEKIHDSVSELSRIACFNSVSTVKPNNNVQVVVSQDKPHSCLLHRGIIKPVVEIDEHSTDDHVEITIQQATDSPEYTGVTCVPPNPTQL